MEVSACKGVSEVGVTVFVRVMGGCELLGCFCTLCLALFL